MFVASAFMYMQVSGNSKWSVSCLSRNTVEQRVRPNKETLVSDFDSVSITVEVLYDGWLLLLIGGFIFKYL